jgi:hypothetical protein
LFGNENPKYSFEKSVDASPLNIILPEKIDNNSVPVELVVKNIYPVIESL